MIDWNQIEKEIIAETKDVISIDRKINLDKIASLFIDVLRFSVDDKAINGIETRLPNALEKILVKPISRIDKNAYFPEASQIEPYLRKILYLVKPSVYVAIKNDKKKALGAIISLLELNPNKVDFSWTSLSASQKSYFAEHLIKAYNLRNLEGHNCTEWTNAKLYDELRSVLVIYLYATYKYQRELKIAINPFDVSNYLRKEIQRIKVLQSRFVHIDGKEEIDGINLYAKELLEDDEIDKDESQNIREGTIDSLRKSIKEKKMIILGDVGMGKSTTLLFLHLQDAQSAIVDSNKNIPIYLELKNLTDKDDLFEKLKSKLNIDKDVAETLFEKGRINLFLDGLNEIEKKIKVSIFNQINNLIENYPDNFYLITSRPQHYNREFDSDLVNRKIPVFTLQKMVDSQIEEFLTKNGKKVKDYILNEINNNNRLKRIVRNPLMLTMLIGVVLKDGKIPNEKGKIIRAFMFSLYDREQKQIFDFDIDLFHLLLCYLGFQTRDLTGSNSSLERDEYIIPILQERKKELGLEINLLRFLRKAIDLNILVNDSNQFSFSHELFQEYYAAEFLHALNE
ncbi:NACHT domain-containing NTPase [Polaribacter sp. HaHaR_3_91]|uniref:NACHT domain-containing protein n=1 Tax=Polaribacter sp. HaHaR_3_91 TaxID=2745561 RepID=UPI001C4EAA74|nr:NACHT domain-containing protein [Polaribacter sp. HaHaR_3_91]QXP62752.1 NACHT domain-containing protein [Polaribacter sp. HaHaR_3_91]